MLGLIGLFMSLTGLSWYNTLWVLSVALPMSSLLIYSNIFNYSSMAGLLMMNKFSVLLIWLTVIVALASLLASQGTVKKLGGMPSLFLLVFAAMNICLVGFFSLSNMMGMYFMFEATLIPMFLLILGWGYQPERLQASSYLMLYTVFGSLPLLLFLCWMDWKLGSGSMPLVMAMGGFKGHLGSVSWALLSFASVFGFSIKFPMYGVHNWLPKAHVEAPVAGSMVLAGVLLKMGGYGMILVMLMFPLHNIVTLLLASLFMWGGVLAGFVCFVQTDMKTLIAYSSVSHMAFSAFGLLVNFQQGWLGSLGMMVGHGLCSPAMFCLAAIMYSLSGSRSLLINKGFMSLYPSISLMAALVCSFNLSSPPTLSLLGEFLVYSSCVSLGSGLAFCAAMITFLSMVFSFYLYVTTQHGPASLSLSAGKLKSLVYLPLIVLILPLNLMLFLPLWGL